MVEAVRTSETSVDNHFTRQYNPEDSSEHSSLQHNKRLLHSLLAGHTVLVRHQVQSLGLLTCSDHRLKLGLRGERPATNRLSHGKALLWLREQSPYTQR
jgi:hypothetical protein